MYYRDAAAAIVCYDVTNERSFDSVSYWINEMKQKSTEEFCIAIAGNKADVDDEEWEIHEEGAM